MSLCLLSAIFMPPTSKKLRGHISICKAPDKQRNCVFTQLKQREYANKLICVRTKTQTKFVGTQCKNSRSVTSVLSVYATIAVSNCKQLSGTNLSEKTDKI